MSRSRAGGPPAGDTSGSVTIAVDLGNTAAKWAVGDQALQSISLRAADWAECIINAVIAETRSRVLQWRIASVNRPMTKALVNRLSESFPEHAVHVIEHGDILLVVNLPNPERVGIDRLLAAWMATRQYPGRDAVVVSAGSAMTVNFVNAAGEFLGGAILPGLNLQFESLARGTDLLPTIELPLGEAFSPASLDLPAVDTASAIRSGVLIGGAAAIDRLVREGVARLGFSGAAIVFTGGDAVVLAELSQLSPVVEPRWLVDAIAALWRHSL